MRRLVRAFQGSISGSWAHHVQQTLVLGVPLVGTQLTQTALNITNTLMLGRLGPDELAASAIAWQLFFVIWTFGSGFGLAVMPLVAGAVGAGDPSGGRRFVIMGLWATFGYSLMVMPPLWWAEAIFLGLGQNPHISKLAAEYIEVLDTPIRRTLC